MKEDLQRQVVNDLIIESLEALDTLDHELLSLGKGNCDPIDALRNSFRLIHTIKGSSGCLGLSAIETLAHAGENLMSRLRDGKQQITPAIVSLLLKTVDGLRQMIRELERTGSCGSADYSGLIALLKATQDGAGPSVAAVESAAGGPAPASDTFADTSPSSSGPEPFGFFDDAPGVPDAFRGKPGSQGASGATNGEADGDRPKRILASESAIRVDVGQIDRLMNLVGELVLARNQIVQYAGTQRDSVLQASVQRVNLITTELQESVMKTRMQPIGNVWAKFPRIVHDVAEELGKRVTLLMEGSETELDRTIIEAIKDPLMHIVRNAIDHGIERPSVRAASGKRADGQLLLRAYHEGGQVIIEIMDDGAGIASEKVLQRAINLGLVSTEQASRLSEREVLNLIFAPGCSTADQVTNISGRGVGMDVVRTNIEKLGGTVDVSTERGKHTTVRIKIPLTLAIIPALIIACSGERYAIPQASLVELVRIEGEQVQSAVEYIGNYPVYRLRGSLLPLVYLQETLRLATRGGGNADSMFIVVLQAEGRQFGLVVDEIHDTEEIVVKPLGKELKGVSTYAGATIMGDGRVALIVDVIGVARRTGILEDSGADLLNKIDKSKGSVDQQHKQSLLVTKAGDNRLAIELDCVTRLEELSAGLVEHAGKAAVVQYRAQIMPLIDVASVLGFDTGHHDLRQRGLLRVVVCSYNGRSIGLVMDSIDDIVEDKVDLAYGSDQPGIRGSGVVQGKVTDFLDIDQLIARSGVGNERRLKPTGYEV